MVPVIDLLNTFVPVASGPSCWNCQFSGDFDSGAELKAVSHIQPGDELTHLYSELSSAALWASYGFVPDEPMENPHEAALIDVPLEEEAVSSYRELLGSLAPRHWRDEKTLLFEVPWDAEEETGPVYATLFALLAREAESAELAGDGAVPARLRLAAKEVVRQRIQEALQKNLASERELSRKDVAGRKHADFEAGARKLPDLGDKHEGLKDEPVTLCIASKFKRFDVVMKDASKFVKSVAEIRGAQRTFP